MVNFDKIELDCNINRIEIRAGKFAKYLDEPEEKNFDYPTIYQAIVCNNKANEPDDLPEEPRKGTRKVTNRAERRAATRKAKRHLKEIEPLTDAVRQTKNGGYVREGNTYGWIQEWKRLDHKANRAAGKSEIAAVLADMQDECEDWELDTLETFPEREDGCIDLDAYRDEWYGIKDFDFYTDEDCDDGNYIERRVWSNELNDHIYISEETELGKTRRELARYKEFVDSFNLNTLFERWLAYKER